MLNYKMICHGYCKFINKCVTYTYKAVLKNGSALYFETRVSDFKSIQDLKPSQFIKFYISNNSSINHKQSDHCKDLLILKTIAQLN